ncbi:hypothetical protein POM88_035342 [Heracleum sosnowskyi]|uniref:Uncharacterized protein n=1 Tax=Heracleum sosnowskyi TaxID=360622 RepID=A0AAD8HNA8_9APIA|nr:hypothetical protein POM88_035342 [Heracleum sosnowskyi]
MVTDPTYCLYTKKILEAIFFETVSHTDIKTVDEDEEYARLLSRMDELEKQELEAENDDESELEDSDLEDQGNQVLMEHRVENSEHEALKVQPASKVLPRTSEHSKVQTASKVLPQTSECSKVEPAFKVLPHPTEPIKVQPTLKGQFAAMCPYFIECKPPSSLLCPS